METLIEKSDLHILMDKVKNFDCEPGIYNCHIFAAGHYGNFHATASFRSPHMSGGIREVSAYGDTPEDAMRSLLMILEDKWGKCPHCGGYLNGGHDDS